MCFCSFCSFFAQLHIASSVTKDLSNKLELTCTLIFVAACCTNGCSLFLTIQFCCCYFCCRKTQTTAATAPACSIAAEVPQKKSRQTNTQKNKQKAQTKRRSLSEEGTCARSTELFRTGRSGGVGGGGKSVHNQWGHVSQCCVYLFRLFCYYYYFLFFVGFFFVFFYLLGL